VGPGVVDGWYIFIGFATIWLLFCLRVLNSIAPHASMQLDDFVEERSSWRDLGTQYVATAIQRFPANQSIYLTGF
jgi:hypothetical protein